MTANPSETPRTDKAVKDFPNDWNGTYANSIIELARTLERDLRAAQEELAALKARLEEAGKS